MKAVMVKKPLILQLPPEDVAEELFPIEEEVSLEETN
ncbi:hypothetical protein IPA_04325 [Ignicoccus pacificus DSM 13166]|uniref:Uncharacterized protein n=1 Tax=Ignicoccus pacificus DSM 13166 TaxID=940294 RepID=A0A977PKU8_9CREN|nr:hypothetical protein IPA_04325 [Ignicoccus pacificus DSM 13166]